MLNVYNYHETPDKLHGYDDRIKLVDPIDAIELLKSKNFEVYLEPQLLGRVLTDPVACYKYAKDILHGEFKEGEPMIATEPYTSFLYARDVLKGAFPLGEKSIAELNDRTQKAYENLKNKQ